MISVDGANAEVIDARSHAAAQFRPQFLGDDMRIGAVADDLRADEHDQFGAGAHLVLVREGIAEARDFVQDRNARSPAVLLSR